MGGTVIENVSNRKMFAILVSLLLALIVFFLLGAICSPQPSSSMEFIMVKCNDNEGGRNPMNWLYIRPPHCDLINDLEHFTPRFTDMRDIVFVAQMPHQRDGVNLEYSVWFQFLLGLLEVDIEYNSQFELAESALIQLEVRLGYRTRSDGPNDWHELISTNTTRTLECTPPETKAEGHLYNCAAMDLFELGSNPYPFYLINLRLPVDQETCRRDPKGPNCAIGRISDLRIIAIHQNGGFTAIWLWLKTFVSPIVIAAVSWYWNRIVGLNRFPCLLEKAIFALGLSLAILDFPLEWASLWFRAPFMLLVSDIRQGLFYAVLFSFWLIFAGEHLIDDTSRNDLASYWRNLASVLVASTCLLVYDIAERGMQLSNPFFSIWASETGSRLAYTVVYIASICVFAYFGFLAYKVWRVWSTIKRKRAAQLYHSNENRRLKALLTDHNCVFF
ncbi:Protein wntless -like protein [Toxocara canis]|uniref:Protein wntless-like protein n=1 Tax=Toxocara canis TaxID=6265 RepID=A0A0B2VM45_TOXCA|nr:Protein wntless -like protein [Toxocara canis]